MAQVHRPGFDLDDQHIPDGWLDTLEDWADAVHERGRYARQYATMRPVVKEPKPAQLSLFEVAT